MIYCLNNQPLSSVITFSCFSTMARGYGILYLQLIKMKRLKYSCKKTLFKGCLNNTTFFFFVFADKDCRAIVDVAFVIDSSGSIGPANWERMKQFLKAVVSKLDISPTATRIAVIAYSTEPEVVMLFSDRQSTEDVNRAFDSMRWQRGFTFTDRALKLADSDLFQTANGMRPSVPKVKGKLSFSCQSRLGRKYSAAPAGPCHGVCCLQYKSNTSYELKVPKTKCKTFGDRAFDRAGPSLWNTQARKTFFYIAWHLLIEQILLR